MDTGVYEEFWRFYLSSVFVRYPAARQKNEIANQMGKKYFKKQHHSFLNFASLVLHDIIFI
jgi:hypothetical protein